VRKIADKETEKKDKNAPVQFRSGQVSVSVFQNERTVTRNKKEIDVIMYSIQVQKSYKDDKGKWQNTNSFNVDEIHALQTHLQQAFEYCLEARKKLNKEKYGDEAESNEDE